MSLVYKLGEHQFIQADESLPVVIFRRQTSPPTTIFIEDVPEAVGIMYTNCGKIIGCLLDNKTIETLITPFVTNMVFQHVGLSWITKSNQKPNFYFQLHFNSWIINDTWYNTMIF